MSAYYQLQLDERKIKYDSEFPSTRYQGSKQKMVSWIWKNISNLKFDTFLDAFNGTACVGFYAKTQGKRVTCNDVLKFNYQVALALIENNSTILTEEDVAFLLNRHDYIDYPNFIQNTFKDIYYTDEENAFLDVIIKNIEQLDDKYKKAIAFSALGQACLVKRPFNLFHRKNLYARFANVPRSFGNKATWDKPFPYYFKKFVKEYNDAVFPNGKTHEVLNLDVFDIGGQYDLVYIDTPYISADGVGVDYFQFYHFLEGIVDYANWHKRVDYSSKHRRMRPEPNVWVDKDRINSAFNRLFNKFRDSILVVSYRFPGIPSKETLKSLLGQYKKDVVLREKRYKYVLSKEKNERNGEILLIGK